MATLPLVLGTIVVQTSAGPEELSETEKLDAHSLTQPKTSSEPCAGVQPRLTVVVEGAVEFLAPFTCVQVTAGSLSVRPKAASRAIESEAMFVSDKFAL
jgi:hypothetical protein